MNERIKKLAVEAGMVMYPTGLGISENTIWGDKNIEKFAELIIRECERQIRNTDLEDVDGGDSAVICAAATQVVVYFSNK